MCDRHNKHVMHIHMNVTLEAHRQGCSWFSFFPPVQALIGTDGPAIFIASEGSRYRFAADRYAQLVHGKEREQLVDATRVEGAMGGTSSRMMAELAQNMRHPDLGVPRCASAQRGMTFAGRDAVNWIISNE